MNHRFRVILAAAAVAVLLVMAFILKFLIPGYSFSALVCLCLAAVIVFYAAVPFFAVRFPRGTRIVTAFVSAALAVGILVCAVTEGVILWKCRGTPDRAVEYVVVLGAKVREDGPSVSLWDRIHGAYDYMTAHPDVIAIVSGGQGGDEPMTEAQSMYDELIKLGIEPERVWMEEKATSTMENLTFSLDLIQEKTGTRPDTIGVLSSEYHLCRAELQTKALGVEFVGIPAKTSRIAQRVNHSLREIAGVWHFLLLGY